MPLPPELTALAAEDFVLVTTFRRDGRPVPTPVWIAADGDHLVVSTPEGTGKLKRLAANPQVTLQACSRRGTPKDGAPVIAGTAAVSRAPAVIASAESRLRAKYGVQWRMALLVEKVVKKGRPKPRPVLLVTGA